MNDVIKVVCGIIMFITLVVAAYSIDYAWKKHIVKEAIRELQQEKQGGK